MPLAHGPQSHYLHTFYAQSHDSLPSTPTQLSAFVSSVHSSQLDQVAGMVHQMQNHPGVLATKVRYIGVKSTKDEDKMVGTSYIDDTIWPRYAEAPTYCGCLVHTRLCGST